MALAEQTISSAEFELIEHLEFSTEQVIGARARIGVVVLATDYTLEHEFRRMIQVPGIDTFAARVKNSTTITPESLAAMGPRLTETAELILPGDSVDVLAYGCTSASMVLGAEAVSASLKAAKPMAKTTNPISAAFTAFDTLGAKRIAVLTPYRADVNEIVRGYIEKNGYEVPVFGSFNEEQDPVVASIDGVSLKRAVQRIISGRHVDAVFVSCTSVRFADQVEAIEAEFGLPVTSSNHAMAWHCLRLAGYEELIEGFGRLFRLGLPR